MDGALTLLLVVGAICLAVLAWAGRKRFPLRIGAGNFFRRKTQVAIVVAGLLIGTAIISSSLVIQTTFDFTVRAAVFRALDAVDEVVYVASPNGGRLPFSTQVYDNLTSNLASMPTVERIAPRYQLPGAVVDTSSQLFDPTATVIGFDATRDLGAFVRSDGSTWDGSGLSGTEAIINANLATAVEAKVGHGLVVSLGTPRGLVQIPVTVKEIVRDEGRGAWNDGENLFVPLPAFQAALGESGKINTITVANDGGATQGYLRSDDVVREMTPFLPAAPTFTIAKVKADSIDGASRNIDQLSQVFVLLGFFTVIAGILLIVNIFVMLAEERKGEMGVARALGMRRTNLVHSFVSEGLLYALLSSVIGTFTGLLVAAVILWGFSQGFGAGAVGGTRVILSWSDSDLINGFAIGFLITMATIVIASWRVSKLNIVRAIRDIPEPIPHGSTRRQVAAGRPDGDRVPDEQEVPHGRDPREHRPRHVHDRDDVGNPGRGELVNRQDEHPRERRFLPDWRLRRPDRQCERCVRYVRGAHGLEEHHERHPELVPGSPPNQQERELRRSNLQHEPDRRALRLNATVRTPGSRPGVSRRGGGLGRHPVESWPRARRWVGHPEQLRSELRNLLGNRRRLRVLRQPDRASERPHHRNPVRAVRPRPLGLLGPRQERIRDRGGEPLLLPSPTWRRRDPGGPRPGAVLHLIPVDHAEHPGVHQPDPRDDDGGVQPPAGVPRARPHRRHLRSWRHHDAQRRRAAPGDGRPPSARLPQVDGAEVVPIRTLLHRADGNRDGRRPRRGLVV